MNTPRLLIYLGHPAHYYLFKHTIKKCLASDLPILVCIKKKDVLEQLLIQEQVPYTNIMHYERNNNIKGILGGIVHRTSSLYKLIKQFKPTVLAGTSAEITWLAKWFGATSFVFNEDDYVAVKKFCLLAYPLATGVVAPNVCKVGKWFEHKKLAYNAYHELAYLHPNNFTPNEQIVKDYGINTDKPYFVLRFSSLGAFHDVGKTGITDELALQLIKILSEYGACYITSERNIGKQLEKYRLAILPHHMHHILAFAKLYIGDSQTMTAEASVLGVKAIRFNDFVGKLSYLEELEHKFNLSKGFKTHQWNELINYVSDEVKNTGNPDYKKVNKNELLAQKVDPNPFFEQILLKKV